MLPVETRDVLRVGAEEAVVLASAEETGGDLDAARTLLREKGMAQVAKRAGRATTEGLVGFRIEGGKGTIAAVGCETEPVSKNEAFQAFAKKVLETVHADGPDALASLEQDRVDVGAKLGERAGERVRLATALLVQRAEPVIAVPVVALDRDRVPDDEHPRHGVAECRISRSRW